MSIKVFANKAGLDAEWIILMDCARRMGLTTEEIKEFLVHAASSAAPLIKELA